MSLTETQNLPLVLEESGIPGQQGIRAEATPTVSDACFHFTDGVTEAQRGVWACAGSRSGGGRAGT